MIATPQQPLAAAASRVREAGVQAHILSDEIEGESREVGKVHAATATMPTDSSSRSAI